MNIGDSITEKTLLFLKQRDEFLTVLQTILKHLDVDGKVMKDIARQVIEKAQLNTNL